MMENNLCNYIFDELVVMYDTEMLTTNKTGDDLIFTPEQMLVVELRGLKADSRFLSEEKVKLELFCADSDEPIYVSEGEPYDREVEMAIERSKLLQPGKYYVRIHNAVPHDRIQPRFDEWKGAYRYTFYLLESGEGLEHPELKKAILSPDLKLTMEWGHAMTELDRFDVIAYNDDWELMGKAERLSFRSSCFKTFLKSSFLWTDGAYFMVVSHNGEPFLRLDFEWKDGKAGELTWVSIDKLSPYYMLEKHLRKATAWQKWQTVQGGASVRKKLAAHYVQYAFNQMRMHYRLPECWENGRHVSLVVEDQTFDKDMLRGLAELVNPQLSYMEQDCSELLEHRNDTLPGSNIKGVMEDWGSSLLCLHHLSALAMSGGTLLLKAVEEHLRENKGCALMLVGTESEILQVMESSTLIRKLIPDEHRYRIGEYTLAEQVHYVQRFLMKKNLSLSDEAGRKLLEGLQIQRSGGNIWHMEQMQDWMNREMLTRFSRRVLSAGPKDEREMKEMLSVIEAEDIHFPEVEQQVDGFSVSMEELNNMVGLGGLKDSLKALFCRSRMDARRRLLGLPVAEKGGCHMIFTGNPGTGKTTVARMVGRVFHSLGLLSKGGVVVTERSKLVGRYIGDTENNVRALLEQAKGNVLFIDEAYNLYDGGDGKKDFGHRVIESLLTVLSQKNPDLIVVLAGYEKEMQQMLESNPGMKGRFPYHFHFEDYNAEELMQIARNLLTESEYFLTSDAEKRLEETIKETVKGKDAFFHNARWVEQYIHDGILTAMSERLMNLWLDAKDKRLFQQIELEDVEKAYVKMRPKTYMKTTLYKRIGFVA